MIDRTGDFWSAVNSCSGDSTSKKAPHLLKKPFVPRTEFGKSTKTIISNITKLRQFLVENKKDYVGVNSGKDTISDAERDKIDTDCQKFIKTYSESLLVLRQNDCHGENSLTQRGLHQRAAADLLDSYLKSVCQIYSDLRAIRVKQIVEQKQLSRLKIESFKTPLVPPADDDHKIPPTAMSSHKFRKTLYEDSEDEITADDEAAFEQENAQMLSDMNSMMNEVKAIEGKVVEIARLQEIFSEQVYQQEGDIDIVSESIIQSTENIKGGNEELREAIKNNAGFRVWILFFLVMCSFSLLFLEWYS